MRGDYDVGDKCSFPRWPARGLGRKEPEEQVTNQ